MGDVDCVSKGEVKYRATFMEMLVEGILQLPVQDAIKYDAQDVQGWGRVLRGAGKLECVEDSLRG